MASPAVERLSILRMQIAESLGVGNMPENRLREFRFLWLTTPQQERDGLSFTLRDVEDFVASVRREQAIEAGASKVVRRDVEAVNPLELGSSIQAAT